MTSLRSEIDDVVAEHRLLDHPFYQAWEAGELTQEHLAHYAAQYYQHVDAFPRYISTVHARTEDPTARRVLAENLWEEEGEPEPHPDLWLRFAKALGLDPDTVRGTEALPEVKEAIESFLTTCGQGTIEGVAALYAYESQIPEVSETKVHGLEEHYGLTSKDATAYFKLHATVDIEHRDEEAALLETLVTTDEERTRALEAAEAGAKAARRILDGVWRAHCGDLHDAAC